MAVTTPATARTTGTRSIPKTKNTAFPRTPSSSNLTSPGGVSSATSFTTHPTVILDLGSAFIRIGFSSESAPRHVIPSGIPFPYPSSEKIKVLTSSEWQEILEPLLNTLLIDYLLISNLKFRRVIVLESSIFSQSFRESIATVLLEKMGLASLLFVNGLISPLYALGQNYGLVVDLGRREGRCLSCFGGRAVPGTWNAVPSGYENMIASVTSKINLECVPNISLEDGYSIMEECLPRLVDLPPSDEARHAPIYCLIPSSKQTVPVSPNAILDSIDEIFFDPQNPDSIVYSTLLTLLSTPIDLRKQMAQNLFLVGGGCDAIPHFSSKFFQALEASTETTPKFACLRKAVQSGKRVPGNEMEPIFSMSLLSWMGGSILGTLGLSDERWVHRQVWLEGDRTIYDWLTAGGL